MVVGIKNMNMCDLIENIPTRVDNHPCWDIENLIAFNDFHVFLDIVEFSVITPFKT